MMTNEEFDKHLKRFTETLRKKSEYHFQVAKNLIRMRENKGEKCL